MWCSTSHNKQEVIWGLEYQSSGLGDHPVSMAISCAVTYTSTVNPYEMAKWQHTGATLPQFWQKCVIYRKVFDHQMITKTFGGDLKLPTIDSVWHFSLSKPLDNRVVTEGQTPAQNLLCVFINLVNNGKCCTKPKIIPYWYINPADRVSHGYSIINSIRHHKPVWLRAITCHFPSQI